MALTIYGAAASRAVRPLWAAAALGLAFEHIDTPYAGGATCTPEFWAITPDGRIPALDHDGVAVWESMACALYLAERFRCVNAADLWAQSALELSAILKWSFWVVTECEKDALAVLMHTAAIGTRSALACSGRGRRVAPGQALGSAGAALVRPA